MINKFLNKHWRTKIKPPAYRKSGIRVYHPPLKKIWLRFFNPIVKFILKNWAVLLAIIVSAIVALFIHFDSKTASKTPQKENHQITGTNHVQPPP